MKAVVMEVRRGKAVVLDHRGTFRIIKDKGFAVGQVLDLPAGKENGREPGSLKVYSPKNRLHRKLTQAAAAAAVVVLATGGGIAAHTIPISAVTVELDATVVYHLNVFDKVVSVESGPAGGDFLSLDLKKEMKGKPFRKALETTLEHLERSEESLNSEAQMNVTMETRFGKDRKLEEMVTDTVNTWNENHPSSDPGHVALSFVPGSEAGKGVEPDDGPGRTADRTEERPDAAAFGPDSDPGMTTAQPGSGGAAAQSGPVPKEEAVQPDQGKETAPFSPDYDGAVQQNDNHGGAAASGVAFDRTAVPPDGNVRLDPISEGGQGFEGTGSPDNMERGPEGMENPSFPENMGGGGAPGGMRMD